VNFTPITICVASQRVLIVVSVYFVIESVRKLLDTPSYVAQMGFVTFSSTWKYSCAGRAQSIAKFVWLVRIQKYFSIG